MCRRGFARTRRARQSACSATSTAARRQPRSSSRAGPTRSSRGGRRVRLLRGAAGHVQQHDGATHVGRGADRDRGRPRHRPPRPAGAGRAAPTSWRARRPTWRTPASCPTTWKARPRRWRRSGRCRPSSAEQRRRPDGPDRQAPCTAAPPRLVTPGATARTGRGVHPGLAAVPTRPVRGAPGDRSLITENPGIGREERPDDGHSQGGEDPHLLLRRDPVLRPPASTARSRPTSIRPWFKPPCIAPCPRGCSRNNVRSTGDFTAPSAHSTASISSNNSSRRAVRHS